LRSRPCVRRVSCRCWRSGVPKLPNPAVGTNFVDAFKTMVGRIVESIRASGRTRTRTRRR
jgi:hypothetical protein